MDTTVTFTIAGGRITRVDTTEPDATTPITDPQQITDAAARILSLASRAP
jgi:hypothetical protein